MIMAWGCRAVSLIGFDDVWSPLMRPRLTTIRYPIVTMATQAAGGVSAGGEVHYAGSNSCIWSDTGTPTFGIHADGYRTPVDNRLIRVA